MSPEAPTVVLAMRSDSDALPFVDSGRGSSIPSKQSSQGIDEEIAVRRVKPRKRKSWEISRQQPANSGDEIYSDLDLEVLTEEELGLELEEEELEPETPAQQNKRFCVGVRLPPLVYPKSQYEGYRRSLPKEKEWLVVEELLVSERKCTIFSIVTDKRHTEK